MQPGHAPDQDPKEIIKDAIATGYRYIDCAQFYGNEAMVGTALAECGVARSELYIVSKVCRGACNTCTNQHCAASCTVNVPKSEGDRRRSSWRVRRRGHLNLLKKAQATCRQEIFAISV